ncbi:MAG: glutamate--tRNA ligase [bacterium]|nr:glutamate--tRNA ligase [bacterium]
MTDAPATLVATGSDVWADRPVRTRFAPSPTGSLHIGGLRTALFNWLYARNHGGQFILRIEDTDQKRFDPTALQTLVEAMRWAGVTWDEGPEVGGEYGPYVQSERLEMYQSWGKWLVENDYAYTCYCSSERLEQVNKEKQARKEAPGYDRRCRFVTEDERQKLAAECAAEGRKPVIRFKFPLEGTTVLNDLVRGEVSFENKIQQDSVILKSDGFPTYHLAVVIDDHFMQISHVMRAVEWLPSAPLHVHLWQAFGWEMPHYAHLPVMLNPNGKGKMSKRNPPKDKFGNVIPVMVHDYIRSGYLPEALDNFLINIGWSYGEDREVFSLEEAIERFTDFSRINPANSAFPPEKLDWLNGVYIREKLSVEELARRLRPVLENEGYEVNVDTLLKVTPLVQTRIKTLNEVISIAGFFFREEFIPAKPEELIQKKMDTTTTKQALERSRQVLEGVADFTTQALHDATQPLTAELGLNNSQLFGLLRVAVTGQTVSTPTFETMEILGKDKTLKRLDLAASLL